MWQWGQVNKEEFNKIQQYTLNIIFIVDNICTCSIFKDYQKKYKMKSQSLLPMSIPGLGPLGAMKCIMP